MLTYALFPQVGLYFLQHRGDPGAFEEPPSGEKPTQSGEAVYTVTVEGKQYTVKVEEGGDIGAIVPTGGAGTATGNEAGEPRTSAGGEAVPAPLAGTVIEVLVAPGQRVGAGERLLILEAMKMETSVSAPREGTVASISCREGDKVASGDALLTLT